MPYFTQIHLVHAEKVVICESLDATSAGGVREERAEALGMEGETKIDLKVLDG